MHRFFFLSFQWKTLHVSEKRVCFAEINWHLKKTFRFNIAFFRVGCNSTKLCAISFDYSLDRNFHQFCVSHISLSIMHCVWHVSWLCKWSLRNRITESVTLLGATITLLKVPVFPAQKLEDLHLNQIQCESIKMLHVLIFREFHVYPCPHRACIIWKLWNVQNKKASIRARSHWDSCGIVINILCMRKLVSVWIRTPTTL